MWHSMSACVIIEITGARTERLLNRMREAGISLFGIRRSASGAVQLLLRARDFRKLHALARRSGCRVRIVEKTGAFFSLRRLFRRKTLWIGTLLVVGLIALASTRILVIEVSGCSRVAERTVLRALESEGLAVGARNYGWNLPLLNERLRTYDARIAWIGLAVEGVVLRVKVVETAVVNDEAEGDAPADVVAQKSGVVTEIIAKRGRAAVAVGDMVQAGDVLIRGDLTTEESQFPVTVRAFGRVLANVVYLSEAVGPLTEKALVDSGLSMPYRAVQIGGLILFETEIPYGEYVLRDVESRTVTDCLLPLVVTDAVCAEQVEQERSLTIPEMAEAALYEAEQSARLKIPKDAAIVDKYSDWIEKDGRVFAVVSITTEESIGLTREWNIDGTQ